MFYLYYDVGHDIDDDDDACAGPGTVFCDNLCYIFMFLSIATSNMVATALAKKVRPFTKAR